jgi:hypothetical protein
MAIGLTNTTLPRFVRAFMRMIEHLIQAATKTNDRLANTIHLKE